MRLKPSRTAPADGPVLEVQRARSTHVEGATVRRALPHPRRRTVGAWCFADHFGPRTVPAGRVGLDVGPHPHCGLATVTWLLSGQAVHRDSLGTVQTIRPGQLNWMTAGRGISHAEEGPVLDHDEVIHGIQLWVAQPEATRHGAPRFEHHAALPHRVEPGLDVRVLIGELDGQLSPARSDTPLFGYDVSLGAKERLLPAEPAFEGAIIVLDGAVEVEGQRIEPGHLAYLGRGRDTVVLQGAPTARLLWLGGEPLDEALLMGWNFVVRDIDELEAAFESWEADDGRFGRVEGARAARIGAPGR